MDRFKGKVAIVTGASSGIGASIAEKLVEHGLQVVGLARRIDKMIAAKKKLAHLPGKLHPFRADMTSEEDIIQAFQWVRAHVGTVHILINNAGVARAVNLMDGDTESFKKVLDTNVLGVAIATREAVQSMMETKVNGHIVNINCICGHYVPILPNNNMYPASKHAVTAMTETLRQELFQQGIKIKVSVRKAFFVNYFL